MILVSLKHAILGFVDLEPATGYTLAQRFDGSTASFWSATQSQIYRELHELERTGLVDCEVIPQPGKPSRKLYRLTQAGTHELRAWLSAPVDPLQLRDPFMLKFVFAAQLPAAELDAAQLSSRTVVRGHSQGGHAALFSALAAQEYAPELEVLGTAALAPATDLSTLATGIKDDAAGKIVTSYIASAWDEIYPELALTSMLDASARSAVSRISDLCFTGKDVLAAMATSSQLFVPVINGSALNGPIGDQLMANSVPFKVPGPVFVAQGSSDTLVLPSMQRGWTAQACAAGSDLLYREYDGLDHLSLVGRASALNADLVNWTRSLLTAEQASANCAG
jgi:DNA-binding PadR family transcriptional regulator